MTSSGGTPRTLLVSQDHRMLVESVRALEARGFATLVCSGPIASPGCPRLAGKPCPLRQSAAAAVVDVDPFGRGSALGYWPERVCTRAPGKDRTVFVRRRADGGAEPDPWEGCRTVGPQLSPGQIVAAVEEQLDETARGRLALERIRRAFR